MAEYTAGGDLAPTPAAEKPASLADPFDSYIRKAVSGIEADSEATRKTLGESQVRQRALIDQLGESDKTKPKPPDIAQPEAPPKPQAPTDAYNAFGSSASILAIFGSLASRRPFTAALKSSAAAMKAIKERDAEAFQRDYKTWKAESEHAGQVAQWQLDRYRTAIEDHKGTQESLLGQLRAIAEIDKDTVALHTMRTGDIGQVEKMLHDRQAQIERYQDHQLKLQEFGERQRHDMEMEKSPEKDAYFTMRKKYPDKDPADIIRAMKMSAGNIPLAMFLQEHPDATAQEVANFTRSLHTPRSGIGMAMQKYMEENPDASAEEVSKFSARYGAMQKATRDFATGTQGNTIRSFETVANHLDTLEQLGDALKNNDLVAFNRIANAFAVQTGQSAPTNFETAVKIVGGEITKAVQGTPGGVTDREEARNAFEHVKSPDQIQGAIGTVRRLVGGQLSSLEHQYSDTTHMTDFRQRLHGKALELLQFIADGGEHADLQGKVKDAGWSYEPEKYDYRVGPDGKMQRKKKDG